MILKKNILPKRLISLMLLFAFICSNILSPNMKAFAELDEDATAAMLNIKSSLEECAAEQFAPVDEKDGYPSNFYQLAVIDGLAYNYIHLLVQKDIRAKNEGVLKNNELYVKFSKNLNSLKKGYESWKAAMKNVGGDNLKLQIEKYLGKTGSIDLWAEKGDDLYFWELKPKSYGTLPKKLEAYRQLYRYLYLPKEKLGKNMNPNSYDYHAGKSSMLKEPKGEIHFTITNPNGELVQYDVKYEAQDYGIIIYKFRRNVIEKEKEEELAGDKVTEKDPEQVLGSLPGLVTNQNDEPTFDIDKDLFISVAITGGVIVIGTATCIWISKYAKRTSLVSLIPILEGGVTAAEIISNNPIVVNAAGEQCYKIERNEKNAKLISDIENAYEVLKVLEIDDLDNIEEE